MRRRARAVARLGLLVLLLTGLSGCAGAGPADTVTVNLAALTDRAVPASPSASRRILGHPGRSLAGTGSRAGTGAARAPRPAGAPAASAVTPLAPAQSARLNGISVWVPYWDLSASLASALAHAGEIAVAHPFLQEITQTATVVDQSGGQAAAVDAQLAAAHLQVIPTVTETARMDAFAATLSHPRRATALLDALVGIAAAPHVNGIDLDFENLAVGNGNPIAAARVATLYPVFVARLCARLHRIGRSCEVTVMANNSAILSGAGGLDPSVYDDAALGRAADRVQVMAYDDHTPGGPSGPIAPWPWVQSVLAYTLSEIPADKVILGVPTYGYDWSGSSGSASTVTAAGAEALAAAQRVPVRWDSADAEPFFAYLTGPRRHRVRHTVWFEDGTAVADRAVLAADDHLAGIALWAAGDEDAATWSLLAHLRRP
ncbi:glycosyl hydrolase family 18 protein [Conexibacter sp. DBS9H8]|uniref:glycosyl hydrolase family 18 protein n=1 Tax=Conexibacter sp. DBS9H8 TaxID=2937801 RepID=UPI00200F71CF|nr:glycosyl hydrolase family 18 protein [Conexibacter sp. DBS9H8]